MWLALFLKAMGKQAGITHAGVDPIQIRSSDEHPQCQPLWTLKLNSTILVIHAFTTCLPNRGQATASWGWFPDAPRRVDAICQPCASVVCKSSLVRCALVCLRGLHRLRCFAAELHHAVWTTDDGLPNSSVTAVLQSHDGYLWLGTCSGLARFDGVRFTVFDSSSTPELQSPNVTALFEMRKAQFGSDIKPGS